MKSFSEDGEVKHNRGNSVKSKERQAFGKQPNNTMTNDTKTFIQKLCFRKAASIDMTRHGFINDSKINPVNYVIEPLREQLGKICVKPASVKHSKSSPKPKKNCEVVNSTERKPYTPKSAMSYPGTRSSRSCFRKVRIQSDPSSTPVATKEKKVKLVSPGESKGENVGKKKY